MTEKQKIFCDEYLKDLNATRAYKVAYPNVKKNTVAATNGGRMLRNAEVKTYIDEQLQELHNERTADAQEIMEYLTSVLRGESKSEIVVIEGEGDGMSSAKRMKKAPDEKERLKAAELLGKRFGIFSEKININGTVPVVIEDDLNDSD